MSDPEPVTISLRVNGAPTTVSVDPWESLATLLRDRLRLMGTKISCDVQVCGACTVLVDGQPVSSCTYLAHDARGRDVMTVEGLASPEGVLHPLQVAFLEENAFQCGFCTSGMLMTAYSILSAEDQPESDEELLEQLNGNICRCTGYLPIVSALLRARELMAGAEPARPAGVATEG